MIFDFDDFGANHVISDMCQTRDCREELDQLKEINPAFKATLFSVPGQMTPELLNWAAVNRDWIELAVHGFYHTSNYECEKMTWKEFDGNMSAMIEKDFISYFSRGFKAPGWQISDDVMQWLTDHNWWIADQNYNDGRRPDLLKAYVIRQGTPSWHGHTWNCMGNGIEETLDQLKKLVAETREFKFVSEVVV